MAGTADDIIAYAQANCPDCCSYQFEPGQIDRAGGSDLHAQHRAVDFGTAECGAGGVIKIYNLFVPMAMGPDYSIEELFCNVPGCGGSWSHGAPSSFVDNPGHVHVGIRAGATLGGNIARTAATNVVDPLGILEGPFKALAQILLDALSKVPRAILEAVFGGHAVGEFIIRVLEALAGAVLLATGVVLVWKVVAKGQAPAALRRATKGPRKAARKARGEVRKRVDHGARVATSEPAHPSRSVAGASTRASETVADEKPQGAKLRKMIGRAL